MHEISTTTVREIQQVMHSNVDNMWLILKRRKRNTANIINNKDKNKSRYSDNGE